MKFGETRKFAHILMVILVIDWGFEYICAKHAMESLSPLSLIFFKYSIGVFLVAAIKFKIDRKSIFRLKDVPILAACAISGDILYYFSEYKAMDYMPISLITIMLALVLIGSIAIERIFFHKHVTVKMLAGMGVCVIGVAMVIGADFSVLFKGRILGYLLCFGAITAWNVFNFLTAKLTRTYSGITLTMNQLLCTILLTLPYGVTHLPSVEQMTPGVIGGTAVFGIGQCRLRVLYLCLCAENIRTDHQCGVFQFSSPDSHLFWMVVLWRNDLSSSDCRRIDRYYNWIYRDQGERKTGGKVQ